MIRNDLYGRLDIYATYDEITPENVVSELNSALAYHIKNMLQEDWFDEVCTDKKLYNESWRNKFVIDFMASEHGIYMATLWKKKDRWDKTKGEFLGALVYAGVLKENKLSFARSYLGIDKNTHDDDEKKQIKTFANYVGQGKSQPYVAWVKDYVNKIKAKE